MARAATKTTGKATRTAETNGDVKPYRLSVTVTPQVRKLIRIAAAVNDMENGEWAAKVLEKAAERAMESGEDSE